MSKDGFWCLVVVVIAAVSGTAGYLIGARNSDIEAIESNRMIFTAEGAIYREQSMPGNPWVFKRLGSPLPYVIINPDFVEKNSFIAERKDWPAFAVKMKYRLEDRKSLVPEDRPGIEAKHFFSITNFFEITPSKK